MADQKMKDLKVKRDNSGVNPEIKALRTGAWIKNAERSSWSVRKV